MATSWTPFNALLLNMLNLRFRTGTAPTNFYLVLTNGVWGADASYATVMASQIATVNGYTGPIGINPASNAIHYPLLNLASIEFPSVQVAAVGGNIEYARAVIISDLAVLEVWADFGGIQTIIPGTPHTFDPYFNLATATAADPEADPT